MPNASEQLVRQALEAEGAKVLNRGWPDFLVLWPDNSFSCVEVKTGGYKLSHDQEFVRDVFNRARIPFDVVTVPVGATLPDGWREKLDRAATEWGPEQLDQLREIEVDNQRLRSRVGQLEHMIKVRDDKLEAAYRTVDWLKNAMSQFGNVVEIATKLRHLRKILNSVKNDVDVIEVNVHHIEQLAEDAVPVVEEVHH